jgi:hypothetical protein
MDGFDELSFQGDAFDVVLPLPKAANIIIPKPNQNIIKPQRNNVVIARPLAN